MKTNYNRSSQRSGIIFSPSLPWAKYPPQDLVPQAAETQQDQEKGQEWRQSRLSYLIQVLLYSLNIFYGNIVRNVS